MFYNKAINVESYPFEQKRARSQVRNAAKSVIQSDETYGDHVDRGTTALHPQHSLEPPRVAAAEDSTIPSL